MYLDAQSILQNNHIELYRKPHIITQFRQILPDIFTSADDINGPHIMAKTFPLYGKKYLTERHCNIIITELEGNTRIRIMGSYQDEILTMRSSGFQMNGEDRLLKHWC